MYGAKAVVEFKVDLCGVETSVFSEAEICVRAFVVRQEEKIETNVGFRSFIVRQFESCYKASSTGSVLQSRLLVQDEYLRILQICFPVAEGH